MHEPAHVFSTVALNETRNGTALGIYADAGYLQHMAPTCHAGTLYRKGKGTGISVDSLKKPVRKWKCGAESGPPKANPFSRRNTPAFRVKKK